VGFQDMAFPHQRTSFLSKTFGNFRLLLLLFAVSPWIKLIRIMNPIASYSLPALQSVGRQIPRHPVTTPYQPCGAVQPRG
jgi:hypothetical protein